MSKRHVPKPTESIGADLSLLTTPAFMLMLGLGIARATMLETMRDPTPVVPGSTGAPRGAGVATSLVLDALCCMPAMLILVRRALDRSYVLRFTVAHALLLALATWAVISTFWSADRFAGAVTSTHMLAAAVLFWSASQLVRSWLRLRIVAATCFGLLLIYTAHGLIHQYIDVPDSIDYWQKHKAEELVQRGWTAASFEARQFEQKLLHGEMIGFDASPNTFAAMMVLCGIISAGVAVQRIVNRDEWGWYTAILVALAPALWVMTYTHSNTSMITPVLATIALVTIGRYRATLVRQRKLIFAGCCFAILIGATALIAHGICHGTLPTDSMRFRWRYWTASMRIFRQHPIAGVGWDNFGLHYLAARLPEAAEEIRDPHNLVVRALVELGIVGAVLMLAWILRGAWELTTPIFPTDPPAGSTAKAGRWTAFKTIVGIAALAMFINSISSVDFSADGAFVALELLRRLLFVGLLLLGFAIVTLRSSKQPILDDRPAPWILYGILVALAIFLLHNAIDFSLFENGPLIIFMILAGAALGARSPHTIKHRMASKTAWSIATAALAGFFAAIIFFVIPMCDAEAHARDGDTALRQRNGTLAAEQFKAAFDICPISNSDYAQRAAQAWTTLAGGDAQVRAMLAQAIASNPLDPGHRLLRARYMLQRHPDDQAQIREDFSRALAIDPNNVAVRIEYARALEQFGDAVGAKEQYRRALELDDKLDAAEPKRLSPPQRDEIRKKL